MRELTAAELLDLVKNPDKYADYIKTIEKARDEFTKIVEKVGPSEEIPRLHEKAITALEQAKEEAATLIDKATAQAASILSEAEKQLALAQELKQTSEQELNEVKEAKKNVKAKEAALEQQQADLSVAQARAQEESARAQELYLEYQAKMEKIRSAMS